VTENEALSSVMLAASTDDGMAAIQEE